MEHELKLISKEPRMHWIGPEWWHHHGIKTRLSADDPPSLVTISNNASKLEIFHELPPSLLWRSTWNIKFCPRERVSGTIRMDTNTLKAAFAFANTITDESRWLIEKYGGEAAEQGSFIRWKDFLNIPGPGTGHDGDPNISILLNNEIKRAVGDLIYTTLSPEDRRRWTTREACREYFLDEGVIRPTNVDDYPR